MPVEAVRVVLQARTNSARLPAKSLLPIACMPMACLAARRLSSTGLSVVLATSDGASDDALARAAAGSGIAVFRGSIDDVLGRFVAACADLGDDAIIVRATGDNPLPDGDLADRLVTHLRASCADIVGVDWPRSGVPYGVSLEAFRLGSLRAANRNSRSSYDREHVTPYLRAHGRLSVVPPSALGTDGANHLRATVDMLDDYLLVERLFANLGADAAWQDLVKDLAEQSQTGVSLVPRQRGGASHSQLVLGTVQLGLPYGRGPERRMPAPGEAVDIVRSAIRGGVTHLDTARAYGESEKRIGAALKEGWSTRVRVVTKLDPLARLAADADEPTVRAFVDASVFASLTALGDGVAPVLLLHRAAHRTDWSGAVWNHLLALREAGHLTGLGVSVADPAQMIEASQSADVQLIQFPYNILDTRWEDAVKTVRDRRGDAVTLHARSALLQGLLVQPDIALWPAIPKLDAAGVLAALDSLVAEFGRASVADLCFAYVRANPALDGIVVGVPSLQVLESSLALFATPALSEGELRIIQQRRPQIPASLLDPAGWPQLKGAS